MSTVKKQLLPFMSINNKSLSTIIYALLFGSTMYIAMDIYTPSLPVIASNLHAAIGLAQLTVAVFIGGAAVTRLLFALLSDAFGRKILVIVGAILAVIGSIICLSAPNIYVLMFGRFLQGLGAGGVNIVGRIILRDISDGPRLSQFMSYFSMTGIGLSIIAPLFGGYLQHFFNWRSIFLVLTIYMTVALFCAVVLLRETNINKTRKHIQLPVIKKNIITLFRSRPFIIYTCLLLITFGCILAWETAAPIVMEDTLGLTPEQFGCLMAFVALFFLFGAYTSSRLVKKYTGTSIISWGAYTLLIGALAMIIPALLGYINIFAITLPMIIVMFSLSLIVPNSFAGAMQTSTVISGITVGIFTSIQFFGSFITSSLIAFFPHNSQLPFAGFLLLFAILSIILTKMLRNPN